MSTSSRTSSALSALSSVLSLAGRALLTGAAALWCAGIVGLPVALLVDGQTALVVGAVVFGACVVGLWGETQDAFR